MYNHNVHILSNYDERRLTIHYFDCCSERRRDFSTGSTISHWIARRKEELISQGHVTLKTPGEYLELF